VGIADEPTVDLSRPEQAEETPLAYQAAGVDRNRVAGTKEQIFQLARTTFTGGVIGDIGAFGSLFKVQGYLDPILVSHTDGVGTKLRVAALLDSFDTVGEDLVHHCVNDILTCGAHPLFFLDYIASGKLAPDRISSIVEGMVRACLRINCALIGGETAEMPGVYMGGDIELVGFVVGAVEQDKVLTGGDVALGDVLLGIPSSGLHTNGYSLVRQIFSIDEKPNTLKEFYPDLEMTLGEALLIPHRCYYPLLNPVLGSIKAMAHITGGGLIENIPRVLPPGLGASIKTQSWENPPLFRIIQDKGKVSTYEMHRVFNMGVGMVLMVANENVALVQSKIPESWILGEVVAVTNGCRVSLN